MKRPRPRWYALALGLAASGSTVGTWVHSSAQPPAAATTAVTYPVQLSVTDGVGPALFLGPEPDSPSIGYVSGRAAIELVEPPSNGRASVRIRGAMRVRGYLDARRLGAVVQRRGRLRGTPVYVEAGDLVRLVALGSDGRAQVVGSAASTGVEREYEGSFPIVGLGASTPAPGPETAAAGSPCTLGTDGRFTLLDQPGGATIGTFGPGSLPCLDLGQDGGVRRVLLGTGPYLAGYTSATPRPAARPTEPIAPRAGAVPNRLMANPELPLVQLAAGTRVMHGTTTVAILDSAASARVVQRYEDTGEVDVFVAASDEVAVRGIVPATAIVSPLATRY